jgi:hypothetical protein
VFENPVTAENFDDNGADSNGLPVIEFRETEYNFGIVIDGEKVIHSYRFKNTGKANLLISAVDPSCGCTSPKWSREPIQPGHEGTIELEFDSKGRVGHVRKTAIIYANTQPNTCEIAFSCDVVAN